MPGTAARSTPPRPPSTDVELGGDAVRGIGGALLAAGSAKATDNVDAVARGL
eukprot:CAMPEP_0179960130 /NCGR_PEP_ID=MMETSP0983-20121128/28950_1 /TAXON_ID=483367 /ORGANISM="non described non described, Strain CCMP 2436" /LENGTH=51 /DNA_ID=CAMNT_0021872407 /DNA_START=130 /DNA_END=283 /DNA_ORIENTATION=-